MRWCWHLSGMGRGEVLASWRWASRSARRGAGSWDAEKRVVRLVRWVRGVCSAGGESRARSGRPGSAGETGVQRSAVPRAPDEKKLRPFHERCQLLSDMGSSSSLSS